MNLVLNVKQRNAIGKKVDVIRKSGYIPGVIYGHKIKNANVSVSVNEFIKIYDKAGESTLIDLNVEGVSEPLKVIIQEVQRDSVKQKFLHVDFYQVNMHEKIHAHISLVFKGEALAVKNFGGVIVTNKNSLEVKCLPADLVHEIFLELSSLENLNDAIRVKDIQVPKGIEVLDNPDEIVVNVSESRTEQEAATITETSEAQLEPQVVGKKEKKEEGEEIKETPTKEKEKKI